MIKALHNNKQTSKQGSKQTNRCGKPRLWVKTADKHAEAFCRRGVRGSRKDMPKMAVAFFSDVMAY